MQRKRNAELRARRAFPILAATVLVAMGVFLAVGASQAATPSPTPIVVVLPFAPTPQPAAAPSPTPIIVVVPAPQPADDPWGGSSSGQQQNSQVPPRPGTPSPAVAPQPTPCLNDSSYVADVTIPDNTVLAPGARFDKTWRVRNSGTCPWSPGVRLAFQSGAHLSGPDSQAVATIPPGQATDITVVMSAPTAPGKYTGLWQMVDAQGRTFGQPLTVVIQVQPPQPPPPTPPPLPQFSARLVRWWPNCGISMVKGKVVEKDGAPVNGVRVRIWADGWDGAYSLVSGVGTSYGPGEWDIMLRQGQSGRFDVAAWDWQTGPDSYVRVDSQVLPLDFNYTQDNCKPEGDGHQVAEVEFVRNY